ncbi:glycoside hydrolase family 2 TIM barrel-domain containing protein [Granulicella sp. S190]|uniref:glycoside hydrolase family 2 protein n=1 Tax=Granulicella sp. S190 TaxID=1747226 RepID=UPI00131D7749|nr:glycoside hydrolase family 2 TIM barrel-domain containing protein [Granulicella sp. S190]
MRDISRRLFLKTSLPVAASAAVPVAPAWLRSFAESDTPATIQRLRDGWEYLQQSLDGPWQVWHSAELATWSAVTLPHCFNHNDACDPDVPAYRGPGWYRRHLVVANPYPGGRTLLHFSGAGQTTDVYVGEAHIARHIGGYDQFVIDITEHAAPALSTPLLLAIRCDNGRDLDRMPSDLSDFTLYGGLYRHIELVYVPAVSLEAIHIQVHPSSQRDWASLDITGRLHHSLATPPNATVSIEILKPDGTSVAQLSTKWPNARSTENGFDGERHLATFKLSNPLLWSPSTPNLYRCRATLSFKDTQHVFTERFGVRFIDFQKNGPFLANGERLLLRGTHRHEDHAGCAAAMTDSDIRQEMQLIKAMGANFIRLAHYQQSQLVLDLCDELGLFVWEELPWCRAGMGNDSWQDMGRQKLCNMIDQHFNHPSVIFWGLGNEDDWPGEYPSIDQDAIRSYMKQLNDLAHRLDPSRYTSYRRCDFARDIPDVYSPSIWAGWYGGLYTEYEHSLEVQRKRVERLLHIEWGADSHARRHSEDPDRAVGSVRSTANTAESGLAYLNTGGQARVSRDGDWSETYACNLFDWHLKTQEALPWLAGSAQWIFKDFTTPLRVENPVPRVNQKGLVERDLTPKESYYVFQSYWSSEPMVHLYGHSWPIRWGRPGELKMVKVYSNCREAELFLNGVSVGVRHRDSQDFPCAGLRWMTSFREGSNQLRVIANSANDTKVTDELNFFYQTDVWQNPATLLLKEVSRRDGIVTCRATLHDQNGILCLDARHQVRFTLAGAARLIDNQGTSSGSRVVELYNGRAEISIRDIRGSISLAVSTPLLPTAICTIEG